MIDLAEIKKRYPFNQDEHYWTVIALAEQLQAENAQLLAECQQLKAHNRQLVEALGELMELSNAPKAQFKIEHGPHDTFYCLGDDVPKIGPQTIDSEERKAYWDAFKTAKQALQTPPAKLAMAEVIGLRLVEEFSSKAEEGEDVYSYDWEGLHEVAQAMREARKDDH